MEDEGRRVIQVRTITRKEKGDGFILKDVHGTGSGSKPTKETVYPEDLGPGVADLLGSLVKEEEDNIAKQGWEMERWVAGGKIFYKKLSIR